jgi:hypothetical protein
MSTVRRVQVPAYLALCLRFGAGLRTKGRLLRQTRNWSGPAAPPGSLRSGGGRVRRPINR